MQLKLPMFFLPAFFVGTTLSASATPKVHRGPTSPRVSREHILQARPKTLSGISPERACEIQIALVKAGYLSIASGIWDTDTQAAMEKLQADNGWQVKMVPDARALIKLGLGPGSDAEPAGSANSLQ